MKCFMVQGIQLAEAMLLLKPSFFARQGPVVFARDLRRSATSPNGAMTEKTLNLTPQTHLELGRGASSASQETAPGHPDAASSRFGKDERTSSLAQVLKSQ